MRQRFRHRCNSPFIDGCSLGNSRSLRSLTSAAPRSVTFGWRERSRVAETTAPAGEMQRSLSLTGITVNAMALIAPGAFLWTTFQLQAAQKGGATAPDMWTGLLFSLVLALL